MLSTLLEKKLDKVIDKESFEKLSSESSYRKPFKSIQVEPFNGESWMIVDNMNQFLHGIFTKQEATELVKKLNDSQEIETYGLKSQKLKESTQNFKIKFQIKSDDGTESTTGEKVIAAPDSTTARKRMEEDNRDTKGFSVLTVTKVN